MLDSVFHLGSGYSSGSGRKVIHTIRPAKPCDTVVSGKWQHMGDWVDLRVHKIMDNMKRWSKIKGFIITNKVYI